MLPESNVMFESNHDQETSLYDIKNKQANVVNTKTNKIAFWSKAHHAQMYAFPVMWQKMAVIPFNLL